MFDRASAEELFSNMDREWSAIQTQCAGGQVAAWRLAFDRLVERQTKLVAEGHWIAGPQDLLTIIGRAQRETFHCAILAWLMDPCAPHRLGARFLEAFVRRAFPGEPFSPATFRSARPACEVPRERSRADIVVTAPDFTLVVEAKVYAVERDGQCDDLFADFQEERGARFVFLTPGGRRPVTATGDAERAFARVSFRNVREDLGGILGTLTELAGSTPAIRSALSYLDTLDGEFS